MTNPSQSPQSIDKTAEFIYKGGKKFQRRIDSLLERRSDKKRSLWKNGIRKEFFRRGPNFCFSGTRSLSLTQFKRCSSEAKRTKPAQEDFLFYTNPLKVYIRHLRSTSALLRPLFSQCKRAKRKKKRKKYFLLRFSCVRRLHFTCIQYNFQERESPTLFIITSGGHNSRSHDTCKMCNSRVSQSA